MKKRIVLISLISLTLSALAFTSYKYVTAKSMPNETGKVNGVKTDLFAINELIAVVKKYQQALTIEADFTTIVVSEDGKKMESFDGKYVKDSSNLYIKSYQSENILNNKFLIAIDNEEHIVFLEKSETAISTSFFQHGFLSDIDSLVNLEDSLVFYEKLNAHTAKISIHIPTDNYYKTDFIYDIKTREIKELRLYPFEEIFANTPDEGEIGITEMKEFNQQKATPENTKVAYIAIVYKSVSINNQVNKRWFDEKRIFVLNNNKFELKNQYKNYEIEFE